MSECLSIPNTRIRAECLSPQPQYSYLVSFKPSPLWCSENCSMRQKGLALGRSLSCESGLLTLYQAETGEVGTEGCKQADLEKKNMSPKHTVGLSISSNKPLRSLHIFFFFSIYITRQAHTVNLRCSDRSMTFICTRTDNMGCTLGQDVLHYG